jgi:hypothetical protein
VEVHCHVDQRHGLLGSKAALALERIYGPLACAVYGDDAADHPGQMRKLLACDDFGACHAARALRQIVRSDPKASVCGVDTMVIYRGMTASALD